MRIHHNFLFLILLVVLTGCSLSNTETEPTISYKPVENDLKRRPSAFEPLTVEERETSWGVELLVGQRFARSLDLYRAITAFKRAQFLIPPENEARRLQIEYSIVESYFLAGRCSETLQAFEDSSLNTATPENFPPFRDLLIMVHACYDNMGEYDKSEKVLKIIESGDSKLANDIQLSIAIREGNISSAKALADHDNRREPVIDFVNQYDSESKSPRKAQLLNAVLPGAGYYYTGQSWTAITSFIINALFIVAAVAFFRRRYYAAALIILCLEFGWYIGGINGAGLAAKEWNEHVYNNLGNGMMTRNDLYPFLMLETTF